MPARITVLRRIGEPAAAAAVAVWSARRAREHTVSAAEERAFRCVNGAPDVLHPILWPVMQCGSLGAVFVTAGSVLRSQGRRRALIVAAAGTSVWGGVKLIKPFIGRGRPAHHLDGVRVRGPEQSGLGYPSGHAAVSLTLANLAPTTAGWRAAATLASVVTGSSRIYVGAHLPLDVLGGFAIGMLLNAIDERWRD